MWWAVGGSVQSDPGFADDLLPLIQFVLNVSGKVFRATLMHVRYGGAQILQSGRSVGVVERRRHCLAKRGQDYRWRPFRGK